MTLDQFKARLKNHDWYYAMSDDHRVWQRGQADSDEIFRTATTGDDDFKRAYNEEHAKYFNRECFTGKDNQYPYKVPFQAFRRLKHPMSKRHSVQVRRYQRERSARRQTAAQGGPPAGASALSTTAR